MKQQKYFNNKQIQNHRRVANRRDADNLINSAYKVFAILGLTALHDEFGFGTKRLERFTDKMLYLLDSYNKGYISPDDLNQVLKDETGISVL